MATKVLMPKLGLTMTEGTIEEWKFKEGDSVKKGDILFSVATDKLTNDVECDTDGVLLKILCGEGETMTCKSTVAYIGNAGEHIEESGDVAVQKHEKPTEAVSEPAKTEKKYFTGEYVLATPCAKKRAKEKEIDLSLISGTGPDGIIVLKDVDEFRSGPKTTPMAAKLAAENGVDIGALKVDGRVRKADVLAAIKTSVESEELVESNDLPAKKVAPLRRAIAANMLNSWNTSPAVTFTYAVDVTALKEMRAKLKDSFKEKGLKLTYNHILMKVVATALTEFPDINASFSDNMVGRDIGSTYPERNSKIGDVVLEAKNIVAEGVKNVSFSVRAGEVLGIGGLVGSGRSELVNTIFGAQKMQSGEIFIKGKKVDINSPSKAIENGIGLIPEDRKLHGLMLEKDVGFNLSICILETISKYCVVDFKTEEQKQREIIERLRIKLPHAGVLAKTLSGGNQQKAVLAKWLLAEADVLIFDEPTRGVDVGAKQEIYQLINELTDKGMAVIMVSSDMEELMGVPDRIIVLHEGECTGGLDKKDFSQVEILKLASGIQEKTS